MTLSWLPVIWLDVLGSVVILLLATLCVTRSLQAVRHNKDKTFLNYIFLLTLSFVFFAVSRSFGHLVKQGLLLYDQQHLWKAIAPFSGSINTATFIIIFSFGVYFFRSRKIYKELENHQTQLARLVEERTAELTDTNLQLKQEISDRIRTELELEKTIAEFTAVMDTIDYGILFMDDHLQTRMVNKAFREMWNVPEKFISGCPSMRDLMLYNRYNDLYNIPDEDFDDYVDRRIAQVCQGAVKPTEFKRKDGKTFQYQSVVLPGNWRMLTYFDITELKKTQEKLTQSQKMEAIGLMAGGVAHDLNNILSGVVSYPDLLLMQLPEDSSLRSPLQTIKKSGQRAAAVVADLLTVARGVASERKVASLNELISTYLESPEALGMLSNYPHIQLKVTLPAKDMLNIFCSPIHITKCLMNLVTNAAEAVTGEGEIEITTEKQYIDKQISENQPMKAGEYAVLTVTDTGQGIGREDIHHIFEPFYTKKFLGRSGTGLGLTIVWNSVQEHNGVITVNSSNKGSVFTLYFPMTSQTASTPHLTVAPEKLQGNGESILIVDDEKQQREIAAKMLKLLNYQVETASSGEKAVTFIKSKGVDLLLLDMIMEPGINGRQTYEQVTALRPGQRAVIVSGFSENNEVAKSLDLGALDFIQKPYTMEQIGLTVKSALTT